MYVYGADFVLAIETSLTSFDQSLTVAYACNFECQLNGLNQLKPETGDHPTVGLSNSVVGQASDGREKISVQVRILIYLLVFNPFNYFVIF